MRTRLRVLGVATALATAAVVVPLGLAAVGLLAFGAVAAWFFVRLAGDVRRLEAHARHIVGGGRGVALAVNRDDELLKASNLLELEKALGTGLLSQRRRILSTAVGAGIEALRGETAVLARRAGDRDPGHAVRASSCACGTHQPWTCGRRRCGIATLATGPAARLPPSSTQASWVN
mgnify:CR=1 FL=1